MTGCELTKPAIVYVPDPFLLFLTSGRNATVKSLSIVSKYRKEKENLKMSPYSL